MCYCTTLIHLSPFILIIVLALYLGLNLAIFLAQDKARLSADIRQYATKISRDFEEKEQLSVESNLWKSKFLACSVIVDELARSKASLQVTTYNPLQMKFLCICDIKRNYL